ncbi:unnamed protein product [Schistocephalus solidus]|uniref:AKAP7_NLS domain-containing protein n=1 Tax=Schistocephalus solidus TaxID=70667 RepID=A0A183TTF1_SCHSO|nr:unnamed protein product [Schistocephalus solidus]
MDTLLPPIIKIDRRLYQKNPSRSSTEIALVGHLEEEADSNFPDEPLAADDTQEKPVFSGPKTACLMKPVSCEQGKYTGTIYVPKIFHKKVIGNNRATQKKLEANLNCKLVFPNQLSPDTNIKIVTDVSANIPAAISRIDYEDLFPAPNKLHFTLANLLLADQKEVSFASKLLMSFATTELGGLFHLTIRGFDCMNDDPKSVYILYATLLDNAEARRLQSVANNIADLFTQHGIHSGRREIGNPVKLHMIVMNSRLRCERQRSRVITGATADINRVSFNASGVLNDYADHTLIEEGQFDEIQLFSLLGEKDTKTSFYQCVAKLNLLQANSQTSHECT